jgi:hypothetical protein
MALTVKQLKEILKDLPDDMEIRGEDHFTTGEELDESVFKVYEDNYLTDSGPVKNRYLRIVYYTPADPNDRDY